MAWYSLLAVLATASAVSAIPWAGPAQTMKPVLAERGFTPKPTDAPAARDVAKAVRYHAFQRRQSVDSSAAVDSQLASISDLLGSLSSYAADSTVDMSATCGFVNADYNSQLTCGTGFFCAQDTIRGVAACCDRTNSDACTAPTTCVNSADSTKWNTADRFMTYCYDPAYPACYTVTYNYGPSIGVYSEIGCAATPYDYKSVYAGYVGETMSDGQPFSVPILPASLSSTANSTSPKADNGAAAKDDGKGGSSTPIAAIAGGAVGGVVVIAAVIGIVVFVMMRRKRKAQRTTAATNPQPILPSPGAFQQPRIGELPTSPAQGNYGNYITYNGDEKNAAAPQVQVSEMSASGTSPVEMYNATPTIGQAQYGFVPMQQHQQVSQYDDQSGTNTTLGSGYVSPASPDLQRGGSTVSRSDAGSPPPFNSNEARLSHAEVNEYGMPVYEMGNASPTDQRNSPKTEKN